MNIRLSVTNLFDVDRGDQGAYRVGAGIRCDSLAQRARRSRDAEQREVLSALWTEATLVLRRFAAAIG